MTSFGISFIIISFFTVVFLTIKNSIDYYIDRRLSFHETLTVIPPYTRNYLRESCRRGVVERMNRYVE